MSRFTALLLALVLLALPAGPLSAGDGKPDPAGAAKALLPFLKKRSLGKRDPADIAKRIEGLPEEDLAWVLARLEETGESDRGAAAPEVLGLVRNSLLTLRYTAAVLAVPDAWNRLRDDSDAARIAVMADLGRLEDAEPGTRFGLSVLEGSSTPVRLKALDLLADLASFGGDGTRLLPALRRGLEDPSPAVRDLALERLVNLSDGAALDWALAHAGEEAAEEAEVRGEKGTRRPGDRAVLLLTTASRLRFGLDGEGLRALSPEARETVMEEFRQWRVAAGSDPLRNGTDGPFDPLPKVSSTVVDPAKGTAASVRWWSEMDRAQFRLDLEDIEVVASTRLDWTANFRMTVGASGARRGDWEAFARRLPCGYRHRLPRKGFGLVETSIQPLADGRWKVWVRAYESRTR